MGARVRLLLGSLVLTACYYGPYLKAAPTANHMPGAPQTAVGESHGVRLIVTGERWHGDPYDLESLVTPVEITFQNHSGVPLRIRYEDFVITNEGGVRVSALPPYRIQRPAELVVTPYYPSAGFFIAGPYAPYYPGIPVWPGPFDYDAGWYSSYSYWAPALPTSDMLRKAIPEGVLNNGGDVEGYMYFPRINRSGTLVDLSFALINAKNDQKFGDITVPLMVAD